MVVGVSVPIIWGCVTLLNFNNKSKVQSGVHSENYMNLCVHRGNNC